jgi:hypothetical protein
MLVKCGKKKRKIRLKIIKMNATLERTLCFWLQTVKEVLTKRKLLRKVKILKKG